MLESIDCLTLGIDFNVTFHSIKHVSFFWEIELSRTNAANDWSRSSNVHIRSPTFSFFPQCRNAIRSDSYNSRRSG